MDKQNLKEVHGYTASLLIELSNRGTAARIGGKKPRWQEIKYNTKGEPYITHYKRVIYLSEVMRVENGFF